MEKIKCIVLDDDLAYCERIASFVNKDQRLHLESKFTNPGKAKAFLMTNPVPLIFIDMEMPGINGIDFLGSLPHQPYAIILTAYPDFAVKAFELDAIDYVLKPFDAERFYSAVNRIITLMEMKAKAAATDALGKMITEVDDYFFVRCDQNFIKLHYKDVLYIEALDNFVKIYLKDTDAPTVTLVNLKQLENTLSPLVFIRIHKSYVVNLNHINSLTGDMIMMGDKMIPIGPSYREFAAEKIMSNKVIRR